MTDPVIDDLRARLTADVRPIHVRAPGERDAPYSRGVIVTIEATPSTSMSFEINVREASELRDRLHEFHHRLAGARRSGVEVWPLLLAGCACT